MANNAIIGARIKQVREEKGMTQEELARELGLNKSTIQRYETAKIEKIKLPVIESIAQKLNVNPEWLSDKTDTRTEYLDFDNPSSASDDELKFALFDGSEGVTDEMFEEVKQFAAMVKMRENAKRSKNDT